MAIPVDITTCFNITVTGGEAITTLKNDCVHPIGVDPTWFLGNNVLTFMNSFKMKMAVIFGVAQMSLGIFMKAFNSIYFGRYVEFFFEFIPQIVLLWSLFGFMNVLIVVKWLTDWTGRTGRAPAIISVMISMFLNFGEVEDDIDPLLWNESRQQLISIILLILAFVSVPLMLLVKPFWLKFTMKHEHERKRSFGRRYSQLNEQPEELQGSNKEEEEKTTTEISNSDGLKTSRNTTNTKEEEPLDMDAIIRMEEGDGENHAFSEIFIHQLIETIEFVLGTVSNTASYLRLWALSLAHSQLADVFFEKLINDIALENNSFILLFLLFPAFFSFTFFVLMCMDNMECFLHTLRLHWVEFQNKFYKGNGYLFEPFSFEEDLKTLK